MANPLGNPNLKPAPRRLVGAAVAHPRNSNGLTDREQLFCDEYLLDLNGTAAAVRSGYSPRSASATATAILKRPNVRRHIEWAKGARLKRLRLAQDEVVKELRLLVFSNISHYKLTTQGRVVIEDDAVDHDGNAVLPEVIRAVSKVKRKITVYVDDDGGETTTQESEIAVYDKNSAIKTYMAHLGIDGRMINKEDPDGMQDNSLVFKEEVEGRRGGESPDTDEELDAE